MDSGWGSQHSVDRISPTPVRKTEDLLPRRPGARQRGAKEMTQKEETGKDPGARQKKGNGSGNTVEDAEAVTEGARMRMVEERPTRAQGRAQRGAEIHNKQFAFSP